MHIDSHIKDCPHMAARWMDDGGYADDDPPPRGRRATRRDMATRRPARVQDMTEADAEFEGALDAAFDDAEFDPLFRDLDLGPEDWFAGRHEPVARHEPAAARLDRRDSVARAAARRDSVARAAARLDRDREQAPHARAANSELQRLHGMRDPPAHSRAQAHSREPDRWVDDFVGVPMDYEQRANCGICLKKKRLEKFSLANCGHGSCRRCVKKMEDAGRKECPSSGKGAPC